VLFIAAICILSENDNISKNSMCASVKFYFKLGKTATETHEILKVDTGEE
jgi:hypothetical protein